MEKVYFSYFLVACFGLLSIYNFMVTMENNSRLEVFEKENQDSETDRYRKRRDTDISDGGDWFDINVNKLEKFVKEKANETFQAEINHLLRAIIHNFPSKDLCKRISTKCFKNPCLKQLFKSKVVSNGNNNQGEVICSQGPRGPPGPRGERGLGLNEPKLINSTSEVTANISDSVKFEMLFFGSPIPKIQWQTHAHNTRVTEWVDKENGFIASQLIISNIAWEDRGQILCSATSLLGKASASATLNVLSPPVITMETGPQFVNRGVNYQFPECKVRAYPKAKITWSRLFWPLPEKRHSSAEESIFKISRVQYKDEGFYTCTAENYLGKAQQQIQMKIKPLEINLENSWDIRNGSGNITCSAFGNPNEMSGKIMVVTDNNMQQELPASITRLENEIILENNLTESGIYRCLIKSKSEEQQAYQRVDLLTLDSKILESVEDQNLLLGWLKESSAVSNYTKCSWTFCKGKSKTLTLIKTGNGTIYGGYSDVAMDFRAMAASTNSFIFNMENKRKIMLNYYYYFSCNNYLTCGPCFGNANLYITGMSYYYSHCRNRKIIVKERNGMFETTRTDEVLDMEVFYTE